MVEERVGCHGVHNHIAMIESEQPSACDCSRSCMRLAFSDIMPTPVNRWFPQSATADARLLLTTRALRGLADGAVSVLLPGYLTAIGFSPLRVGAIVFGTLLGSAALTLWVGLATDRLGRRRILLRSDAGLPDGNRIQSAKGRRDRVRHTPGVGGVDAVGGTRHRQARPASNTA